MSISTGDPRHSAPKKSTTPAAAGEPNPDAAPADEPVGGVLPVKKSTRAGGATGGAAGRPGSRGRTGANGSSRTGSAGSGAAKSDAESDADEESTPEAEATTAPATSAPAKPAAKSTRAKSAPAKASSTSKATPAKTTPAKSTPAKTAPAGKTVKAAPGSAGKSTPASKPKVQSALVGGKSASALGGGKGGGRRPTAPVRVAQSRNWGPIALFVATGLVALSIITIGAWPVVSGWFKGTWQEQAAAIPGIVNYWDPDSPGYSASYYQAIQRPDPNVGNHRPGDLTYEVNPPAGGLHNDRWQNCMGDVYTSQIADEHAVHSMEHGAVWITYSPDLPQNQIDELASKVDGREFMMMSPYPGLDSPISLQAWGYQLKVDTADDGRIDDFITALRRNATQETEAGCSSGITDPSSTPLEF